MSNLAVRPKYDVVRDAVVKAEPGLAKLLSPFGMKADRMVRVTLDLLRREPYLCECTPNSIVLAVLQSAELGLEVGSPLGHAYLISFKVKGVKTAKLIPGYQGLITLAYDEPRVVGIRADHVHENDVFEEVSGSNPSLVHRVDRFDDRGAMRGVYGTVQIRDGWPIFRVLPMRDVNAIRDAAIAKIQDDWQRDRSPWRTAEGEMQLKTALRRVLKLVPLGSRLRRAIELDAQEYGEKPPDPKGRAETLRAQVGDVIDAEVIDEAAKSED